MKLKKIFSKVTGLSITVGVAGGCLIGTALNGFDLGAAAFDMSTTEAAIGKVITALTAIGIATGACNYAQKKLDIDFKILPFALGLAMSWGITDPNFSLDNNADRGLSAVPAPDTVYVAQAPDNNRVDLLTLDRPFTFAVIP